MKHSESNIDIDHTVKPKLSRQQIIGLALFALSLTTILALYGPYAILTMVYSSPLEDAPSEIRNLSGPAVMGLWGITGTSIWLLLLIAKAYYFKTKSTIESLAAWALLMTVPFGLMFLLFFYLSISINAKASPLAAVGLAGTLYHLYIFRLISRRTSQTEKGQYPG
ncbi:hypothetical protein [Gimesia sp.]|uniref:hypothetical protein n=1 Tax=Gimesia sp. TaxID=2024833 RepID=UPI003A923F99